MRAFLCLPLLAASLAAQTPTSISPKSALTGFGNSNNSIPFSWTPTAYQQVHDLSSFSSTTPLPVMKLSLRMASGFINSAGRMIDVELYMADCPTTASTASAIFANNAASGTEVNVFTRKMVNLPTVPNNNWLVSFPFDNLYVFTGATNLSWRAIVWGNSNGNMLFTYPLDAWWGIGDSQTVSGYQGCQSALGTKPATQSVSTTLDLRPGFNPKFNGDAMVANGIFPATLSLGASSTMFQGLPLPFDLGALGAPGCKVTNDILVTFASVTSNGMASTVVPIPNIPAVEGGVFYTQYFFLQPGSNALGVFTSNGLRNMIGIPPGMARIYATGNPNASSGVAETQYGMAIGLN